MSSADRDIRLQSLTLGGVTIPLGGEGVSARLTSGTVGEVTRGAARSIKTSPQQREGVLTISVFPEDSAEPILRGLYNARRATAGSALPFPGGALLILNRSDGSTTQTAKWSDAHFTAVADVVLGTQTEVMTYEIALVGYEVTSVAVVS